MYGRLGGSGALKCLIRAPKVDAAGLLIFNYHITDGCGTAGAPSSSGTVPVRLLVLARPAVGPPDRLAAVVWLPVEMRFRAHAESAFAREGGRCPPSICSCRTIEMHGHPAVDVVEACEFASHVLRRNPRWVCVLCAARAGAEAPWVGELIADTPQWRALPGAHYGLSLIHI